jgi:hypothetical protein
MAGTKMAPQLYDAYWEDLKRTAQEVSDWPEWKKGEIGMSTPTTNRLSRERATAHNEDELKSKLKPD